MKPAKFIPLSSFQYQFYRDCTTGVSYEQLKKVNEAIVLYYVDCVVEDEVIAKKTTKETIHEVIKNSVDPDDPNQFEAELLRTAEVKALFARFGISRHDEQATAHEPWLQRLGIKAKILTSIYIQPEE